MFCSCGSNIRPHYHELHCKKYIKEIQSAEHMHALTISASKCHSIRKRRAHNMCEKGVGVGRYLWNKLRPLVPITTAAGFNLSASLHITLPASPSTILAFVFTYYTKKWNHSIELERFCFEWRMYEKWPGEVILQKSIHVRDRAGVKLKWTRNWIQYINYTWSYISRHM